MFSQRIQFATCERVTVSEFDRLQKLRESDPEAFRKLMLAAMKQNVVPHPHQRPIIESKARFKVVNAGRRFGKTLIAAKIALAKARKPNQMIWLISPTYKVVKRMYAEILRQIPEGVLTHAAPPDSNFDAGRSVILRFKNGSRMEFYSAERPEGMLGAAVDLAILDEAGTMPARIFNQIVSPTLIDRKGEALLISTPRGRNWFYESYLKGQDPEQPEWESWTFTTMDNPTLPEGEALRMSLDMPQAEADQEIYAKWLAAGSSVFLIAPEATQEARVGSNGLVEGFPPEGHVFLGVDLARTFDYTVIYGTRERDRKNVYFERMRAIAWAEQRRRIQRAVRTVMNNGATGVTLLVDEGNAGSVIVEDLQEAGYDVIGISFTTHKANMVRLLANDLERGRAFVLDEKLDEFSDYAMNMTPAGRITYGAPEGRHDDVVSAKMLAHWGCVNEGFGDITVLSANSPVGVQSEDTDPWDEIAADDGDDWSDLLDSEGTDDPGQALEAIGLRDPQRRPTTQELLQNKDLWA